MKIENLDMYDIVKINLSEGLIVKNYPEMCKLLHEEVKDGSRNKKFQMEDWKRYFTFEKKGQKFIITEIYDKPLDKNDKRAQGNNKEYIQHIELLLLNYLSKQKGFKATFTVKKLFLMLSMINQNYIDKDYNKIKENSFVTDWHINNFYQRSYQKLKEVLFGSLRNLKNRRLIDYEELTMINIREIVNGKLLQNNIRIADENEKNYIRDTQREVLKEMKLESITQVFLKYKTEVFYKRVNELLWGRYNIKYSFIEIEILFTHNYVIEALEQAKLNIERKMLNGKVINYMNKQAQNNYDKNQIEYDQQVEEYMKHIFGKPSEMALSKFFKLDDMYLEAQMELAEMLIRV